jgi:hypothetical protein
MSNASSTSRFARTYHERTFHFAATLSETEDRPIPAVGRLAAMSVNLEVSRGDENDCKESHGKPRLSWLDMPFMSQPQAGSSLSIFPIDILEAYNLVMRLIVHTTVP